MTWQRPFVNSQDLAGTFSVPAHFTSGHAIGVITVDLKYPKLPGNVVNATTFDFPVLYKKVEFDIELLSLRWSLSRLPKNWRLKACVRSWERADTLRTSKSRLPMR